MQLISLTTILLAFVGPILAGNVQLPGLVLPDSARANRDAVEKIFTDSYDAYK